MQGKVIWIINQYAGSSFHGMEFRHYYLAKELIKKGNKIFIISGSYSHLYKNQPAINGDFTFQEIDKIIYCWVKIPEYVKSVSLKRFWNMLKFIEMLKRLPLEKFEKPDSIIVSSPSLFPIVRAKKWAKKFQAKLIFEVRDIWPLTLQALGNISKWHPLILFMKWFEKYGYKNSDKCVSLLPGAKEYMIDSGVEENKYTCIPNGINLEEVQNPEVLESAVSKLFPENKFIVGYAGTIGLSNALEYFIEAAKKLKNNDAIFFVIVGNGSEKEKLIHLSSGCKNIIFIESVKKEQIQSLLKYYDVCYIGCRKESLYRFGISPNKLFDYMYSGKPVIHSVEAFNDPVKESGGGLAVEPENSQKISDAILILFSLDKEERLKMGNKGKEYVVTHHLYSSLADKYLQILHS